MTQVEKLICKECKAEFGPLGMHGFNIARKSGDLPCVCKSCKKMYVGRMENGELTGSCPDCKAKLSFFDKKCPKCESTETYWVSINLPFPNQCDRRDPTASRWGMPHSVTTFQIGVAASSGVSNPIWK